jgi:hypothetical protein
MAIRIEDGKGKGTLVEVTAENELIVHAHIVDNLAVQSDRGQAFCGTCLLTSLTSTGSYSGLLYIKNTSADKNLRITDIKVSGDQASCWRFVRGPTAGTLISDETAATCGNINFASAAAFDGSVYKGANGKTVTDGDTFMEICVSAGMSTCSLYSAVTLGYNDSMAVLCKPAASGDFCVAVLFSQMGPVHSH